MELPIFPFLDDAPTKAIDLGVKNCSMWSLFGSATDTELCRMVSFSIILASTTLYDLGYTTTGLKSILFM